MTALALSTGLLAAPGLAAQTAQAAAGTQPLTAPDATTASLLAATSGRQAEVLSDRTDWAQTFAEPGGGFLSQESAVPVRVQQADGSWVPVDTTLSVQPNGSVAPGAIVPRLTMSGGGGPLYTLTSAGGRSVSVSWPYGPLPTPSLSGATATYPGVLPGVNLLQTATPTGVRDTLEVISAAAAANPALVRIIFPASSRGLSISGDEHGGLTAADPSGHAVFTAPPSQMWDSAGGPASALGPQPGNHMAVAAVSALAQSLSLYPAASLLGGRATVYPVFISPDGFSSASHTSWLDVGRNFASPPSYWGDWEPTGPKGGIRSGVYCTQGSNGKCTDPNPDASWGIYRSYLNFAVPRGLAGASYVDAKLFLNETWSWSCRASAMEMWQTSAASMGATWLSRPTDMRFQSSITAAHGHSGASGSCPAAGIALDATPALSAAAAGNLSQVTLELRASLAGENASPPVVNSWKRFQASSAGRCSGGSPCLQVFWLHNPDQGQAIGTEGTFSTQTGQTVTDCATSPSSPDYVNTTTATWDASAGDQDGLPIYGNFPWTNLTTGATGTLATGDPVAAGSVFQGQYAGSAGDEYEWQAFGEVKTNDLLTNESLTLDGPWSSPPCYFTIDTTRPSGTVAVTSSQYQDGVPSGGVGQTGTFTFTDPKYPGHDSDVVGYFYGINSSQPSTYVPASGGVAQITLKPYTSAVLNLYVQAVDRAGNLGPLKMSGSTVVPSFVIIPQITSSNISSLAYWKLNKHTTDSTGFGNDVTLAGSAAFGCGSAANPPGYQCSLKGAEADTPGGVVSPQAGFSVSAWVSKTRCASYCVAMSEDASTVSAFALGYQKNCTAGTHGCWVFTMYPADNPSTTPQTASVAASPAAAAGGWVQLTGVFDPGGGTATLYVDGSNPAATPFNGLRSWVPAQLGALRFGAGFGGVRPWAGHVSDACVFYGVLSDTNTPVPPETTSDIQSLYDQGTGDGCSTVTAAYTTP